MNQQRRWSINGRFLTQPVTGVQRYGHEIVRALDELVMQRHTLTRDLDIELLGPPGTAFPRLHAISCRSVGRVNGHLWEQTVLPHQASGGIISLCNTGPLSHPRHIVCIHDVNTRAYPRSYSIPFRTLYRVLMPLLGRSAVTVTTVSRYSAEQLVHHNICHREKIAIASDGYEHTLHWTPQHLGQTSASASRDTIVVVGSLAPHKNLDVICKLAGRLKAVGLRIAVVGLRDPRVFRARGFDSENITWVGRLSDNDLATLLTNSLCLAFPSFVEGFGLPPLEAMALGCPVVASNRASLPETCGTAALYASPTDADAWFAQFVRLQTDHELRGRLGKAGRDRARLFSWFRSAEIYLRLMARADRAAVIEPPPAAANECALDGARVPSLELTSLHACLEPARTLPRSRY